MKIKSDIFRAYDVRGVYPEDIDEESAFLIGRAFVLFLKKYNKKKQLNIVISRDNRLSSPSLFKALSSGILEGGANVIDMGLSTSPMFYWCVGRYKFDGGVNITASHNPTQYNGMKFVRENAVPISGKTGLKEILKIVIEIESSVVGGKKFFVAKKVVADREKIKKKNVFTDYLKFNLKIVKKSSLKEFKKISIVVDTANAVSGPAVAELLKNLSCKSKHLFKKLDGSFPNHSPDPLKKESIKSIQREIISRKADLGCGFDGDGDRIMFLDNLGNPISGDLITALLAQIILEERPNQKILYDVRSSNIVRETIKRYKGIPVGYRIGHSFIKAKMREKDIVFGGEVSGHYYLREHYFCEAPFFVLIKVLEKMLQSKKSLAELINEYKKYFYSGEINFKVKDKEKVLNKIEQKYKKGKILKLDGIRIDFEDWWFIVRGSNTEPVLRLILEAKTKALMIEKKKELSKIIGS